MMMISCDRLAVILADMDQAFRQRGIATSRLDARLLVEAVLGISHSDIIASPDMKITENQVRRLEQYMQRRLEFEPVSRILKLREFYGREFLISPDVLDPRADTETLIDGVLQRIETDEPVRMLDIGTGSGAIIITLLCELPKATAIATDISKAALGVARHNADLLGVAERVEFVNTDWASAVDGWFDIIVSNPPYIPSIDIDGLERSVKDYDPLLALDGGNDGLEAYHKIIAQLPDLVTQGSLVGFETGKGQTGDVERLLQQSDCCENSDSTTIIHDLAGNDRVILMKCGGN